MLNYSKEIDRRSLETMPFDKVFDFEDNEVLCHATGDEVLFEGDDIYWNEYCLPDGTLVYGN